MRVWCHVWAGERRERGEQPLSMRVCGVPLASMVGGTREQNRGFCSPVPCPVLRGERWKAFIHAAVPPFPVFPTKNSEGKGDGKITARGRP